MIATFAIPAIDQHLTDEQLKRLWLPYEDLITYEQLRGYSSITLRYLDTLFLASGEEEKLNIVLNALGKYVQDNPE